MLPSNMLLLNLILLIEATFSTPTGDFTQNHLVMSGVEKRRSDSSLPVAIGGAFATPPQSGLT
jgi:hypothetical protein